MVPEHGRVVVALSGGPDSVGLVHLLRDLGPGAGFTLAGIAHFNHQLRGIEADADEAFCRRLAASLGVPIETGRGDVRGFAERQKRSIEDAARSRRYEFLHEAGQRLDADAIAVGHTRDDQAETFLLRLIRGSGTRGLGSIRPKAGMIVRPLLETSRQDVRAYVTARGLEYREDATNLDVQIPRNRIRHELLPYLEREFSPNIVEVLAREAALAQIDDDRLERDAIDLVASIVLSTTDAQFPADDRIVIDAQALRSIHPAVASRVVRHGLVLAAQGHFIGAEAIDRLLTFAREGKPGGRLSLPGCEAVHEGDRLRLGPAPPRGVYQDTNSFRIPLSIPGEVVLASQAIAVSAVRVDGGEGVSSEGGAPGGFVRGCHGPLAVRSRRPGDRFQPPGLGGRSKKLQDYFVDRKVARGTRDLVPLVVDADDRIVWVVGHGFSEAFRAPGPSPGVILLKARRLGGEV
jgi:tRNA(Ile)-lysidine synthase